MKQTELRNLIRQQVAEEMKEHREILDLQAMKIKLLEKRLKQEQRLTKLQSRKIRSLTEPSDN